MGDRPGSALPPQPRGEHRQRPPEGSQRPRQIVTYPRICLPCPVRADDSLSALAPARGGEVRFACSLGFGRLPPVNSLSATWRASCCSSVRLCSVSSGASNDIAEPAEAIRQTTRRGRGGGSRGGPRPVLPSRGRG